MRIALAQINPHLGNFKSNCEKIIEYSHRAKERRCDIVLFPEATLFGYHPMDLLKRASVVKEQMKYLKKIQRSIPAEMAVIFGAFTPNPSSKGKPFFNTAFAFVKNKKMWSCNKELLPTYDVFDDARHIEPGDMRKNIFRFKGKKILITICEDIWAWPDATAKHTSYYDENPLKKIKPGSVDLILNLSASPFYAEKMKMRRFVTSATAKYLKAPMAYVNMVGGQDELLFDGGSFAISSTGKILAQCAQFEEDLGVVDFEKKSGTQVELINSKAEDLRRALVMGIRDFINKSGMKQVHLGLSGGIDSAVVACLAVDALGIENVKAYALPGPHSTEKSLTLAKKMAQNIGIELLTIEFKKEYAALVKLIENKIGQRRFGTMHENIQARIRGLILMSISNADNSVLLNTTNKSEFAAGYGTMYGDLTGGLSPIGDLLKRDVYMIAKLYNAEHEVIPRQIIDRAPTAELRPNQKDQDTLPEYDLLDDSVIRLVEKSAAAKSKTDKFLLQALMKSEFKRWQSPPILKVREHSFGQGRRMPIAHTGWY